MRVENDPSNAGGALAMAVYRRGKIWWYNFEFQGRHIQESSGFTNKTAALRAEAKRRVGIYSIEKRDSHKPNWRRSSMNMSTNFSPGRSSSTVQKPETCMARTATRCSDYSAAVGSTKSRQAWSRISSWRGSMKSRRQRERRKHISNATVNRALTTLKMLFHHAEQKRIRCCQIPTKRHCVSSGGERDECAW